MLHILIKLMQTIFSEHRHDVKMLSKSDSSNFDKTKPKLFIRDLCAVHREYMIYNMYSHLKVFFTMCWHIELYTYRICNVHLYKTKLVEHSSKERVSTNNN